MRRYVTPSRAVVLVMALAIVVVYLPALIVPYGLTDDYLYLAQAEELGLPSPPYTKSVMHAGAVEGRPLWGALVKPVFAAAVTIDNLHYVRIINVAGVVALALLLYWALMRSKIGRLPAALIALLVATMPPFQLSASWAVAFSLPWAALLAGCASLMAVAGMDRPRQHYDRLIWSTALLIAALLIYQPCGDVLLGLLRRRAGRLRGRFRACVAAGTRALRSRGRRRRGRVSRLQDLHPAGRDGLARRRSRHAHARCRRQGRMVLALGPLWRAEPLRRDLDGLAGCVSSPRSPRWAS